MNTDWNTPAAHSDLELYITGTGQRLMVHKRNELCDEACVIHNPSEHRMRDFPTHWRWDRSLMERICPHGIGHPDPDDVAFTTRVLLDCGDVKYRGVHGCDGCCHA